MKNFLALVLFLLIVANANTQQSEWKHKLNYSKYCQTDGVKFSFGYFYPGKYHPHWEARIFSPRHGCYIYWCPSTRDWYYWCPPLDAYYPMKYCPKKTYQFREQGPELSPIRALF